MKIYVFDSWRKHWSEGIEWLRERGHDVSSGMYWGPDLADWADVCIFHPVDNNLIQASKRGKPRNTIVIAEAVDVDIYAGHPGAVDWGYVDHLVFMANHMSELSERKFAFPEDLPRYVIPGGIDLKRWTLRKGEQGYNIAWIGRFWIAKNVFGAIQIFHQLILDDCQNPWRLFLRGDSWHPNWYQAHCEAYLDMHPELSERIEFVPHIADLNAWLDDKDFLLQTSYKEAFGYVVAQAAAKGVQPIIQRTSGVLDIWPGEWTFNTGSNAVRSFHRSIDRRALRKVVRDRYSLTKRMQAFGSLMER